MTYSRPRRTTIGPGCLTAVFGMGTGGAIQVCSPRKTHAAGGGSYAPGPKTGGLTPPARPLYQLAAVSCCNRDPRTGRDAPPEGRINAAKRSAVSTGQLRRLPALHTRPIDLVVCQEPSPQRGRIPRLAGGFTLRCLQRLSRPYVATQRCRERDNWHTRGTSLPILSY